MVGSCVFWKGQVLYGKAVGALQGALCSCMERFVESGYGSGRSGVVRFGKVSRGLVGRVLVWQLRRVEAWSVQVGYVSVSLCMAVKVRSVL